MRLLVRIGTVLAVILSTATAAFAQASIAGRCHGLVGRGSAGRHSRGVEPGAHREGPVGHHRRDRSIPDRRSPAGRLFGDVLAERLQRVPARRDRAGGQLRGDGQRRSPRWRAHRNHHRQRGVAARRRAERREPRRRSTTSSSRPFPSAGSTPASRRSCPRSTSRGRMSAARTSPASACSRPTADGATKVRSRWMA